MNVSTGRRAVCDLGLLAVGAGLYTLASPPYEWSAAAWIALTPLFLVLQRKTPKAAFGAGFLYGVLFSAGITFWAYFAVSAYFPFSFPFNLLFTFLIYVIFVCPYTGLAAALSCVLMGRGQPLLRGLGIPALWVCGEFARSSLFAGFSWELLGYTQYRHLTLIQIADVTGVYGLSFLMALSGYLVAETLVQLRLSHSAPCPPYSVRERFPWPALGCFLTGLVLVLLYGTMRLRHYASPSLFSKHSMTIALARGNVPGTHRWEREYYASTLLKYVRVTQQGLHQQAPDLVVWPEFAVGFYLDREPLLRTQLGQLPQALGTALLLGAPHLEPSEPEPRYYNSAYLLGPDGAVLDRYDKRRLLPFAEYRPLALPALQPHSREAPSEFTAGERATVFALPRSTFGVLICYEATYAPLARQLVQNGAQFLVNISNDTWLGGEAAAAQHFSMTVLRAVETRRYLVRVATAGISGFVDPWGRPSHLSVAPEGVVVGEVWPQQDLSVYTRYGDWFVLVCLSVALGALTPRREAA